MSLCLLFFCKLLILLRLLNVKKQRVIHKVVFVEHASASFDALFYLFNIRFFEVDHLGVSLHIVYEVDILKGEFIAFKANFSVSQ